MMKCHWIHLLISLYNWIICCGIGATRPRKWSTQHQGNPNPCSWAPHDLTYVKGRHTGDGGCAFTVAQPDMWCHNALCTVPTEQAAKRRGEVNHSSHSGEFLFIYLQITMLTQVLHSGEKFLIPAVIESGSEGNFMNEETALKIHLQLSRLHDPPNLSTIDGGPIGTGT